MSPPVVVLDRDFVDIPKDCPLVELIQNTCKFDKSTGQFDCTPIPRVYRACQGPHGIRHFEVTHLSGIDPEIKKTLNTMRKLSGESIKL